ncbi:SDR family oxidoreductase [Paenibacillus sp. V4I5]|uniref:SDR family oxidoreductase n=1 Tax=Paenibacillus sp. V4I5 TaxID=3042306 RepID=UPI002791EC1F|nr:SDR family oxidoreductase [Paenibacillus sp. V4I5]MDQ0919940.1 dTDP-4-dehydrorhamnose reductase [Paenibacillus sp. V4I5]
MRLLIIGGNGMAGHMLNQYFKRRTSHSVFYTTREAVDPQGIVLDVRDQAGLESIIDTVQPDAVINCVALLNDNASCNELDSFKINSMLPHQLRTILERRGSKLIHISTDCVFSGKRGDYIETDLPDWTSVYAKTKILGEVISDKHLTIRTSIVGPEIRSHGIGLLHWFMQQRGAVSGYTQVLWNGVTTLQLAKAVDDMLRDGVTGLIHLASHGKISKRDLLLLFQEIFEKNDVTVVPDDTPIQDRTLKSVRTDYRYQVPDYREMLLELRSWMRLN